MGLDYGWTCPDIDRGVDQFKNDIEGYLADMIDECCPMLEGEQKDKFIKGYVDSMYDNFECNFEDVRKANEDMRKEADNQIDRLESEIEDMKSELEDRDSQITDLEGQVSELESELAAVQ